jgi:hypothetical protein
MRPIVVSRLVRATLLAAALAVPAACAAGAHAAPIAVPKACAVLTTSIATSLIKERPRTILSTPLVCQYGRSSERAATTKTTVGLTIVRNPSVAAAKAVQRRVEHAAPKKAPAGLAGFAKGKLTVSGGEAAYVYYYQPGGTITGGYVFLRIGVYTAQLTPQVDSAHAPAFTATDLKRTASQMAANGS